MDQMAQGMERSGPRVPVFDWKFGNETLSASGRADPVEWPVSVRDRSRSNHCWYFWYRTSITHPPPIFPSQQIFRERDPLLFLQSGSQQHATPSLFDG